MEISPKICASLTAAEALAVIELFEERDRAKSSLPIRQDTNQRKAQLESLALDDKVQILGSAASAGLIHLITQPIEGLRLSEPSLTTLSKMRQDYEDWLDVQVVQLS